MKVLLVVYNNDSFIHWFPQGMAYIAAAIRHEHEVTIYNQDWHHYPDEHLNAYLNENKFDVIGVSVIGGYYQYRKLLKISEAINNSKNRPFYVIGGHGPSADPPFFIKKTKADAVVIGEGEETIKELLSAVQNNTSFYNVKGIAYPDGEKTITTSPRPLIKDIDTIPMPAYDLFPVQYYRLVREPRTTNSDFVMPVLTGRGCHFKCNFCYRMDAGLRERKNANIINEIKHLQKEYNINYFAFSDELLMSSKKRVVSLCQDFIKEGLNIKWNCSGRLNYASPEVIKIMKQAGCVFINYGIECYDDNMLRKMKKCLTTEQIRIGIENTLNEGLSPGFNIIFGNIGEGAEELQKGVDFLLKYDDGAQLRTIRPVTPYPGSPLYDYAIEKGMIKDCEDFYENKHTNSDLMSVNFTRLSDAEYYSELYKANETLLNNYIQKQTSQNKQTLDNLYINKDSNFRGFRQI